MLAFQEVFASCSSAGEKAAAAACVAVVVHHGEFSSAMELKPCGTNGWPFSKNWLPDSVTPGGIGGRRRGRSGDPAD